MRSKTMLLAAATAAMIGSAAQADPLQIRLSYIVPVSNWATILFAKPEMATHLGKTYSFEAVHFQGTPQLIQALAAGELEIANFGFTTMPLAVVNAGMSDLRIIQDELQDGVPTYYSNQYMVLKDGPIKTIEDLKGKVLGVNAFGSGTDIPMRIMLAKHNLENKRDLTVVEAPIPSLPAMLSDHKVDMMALPLPFTANPQVNAFARTLFTQGDAMGITQLGMWVAREGFIAKNRAAMVDFMEDALRAERWYFDPKNHAEAVQIAVNVTKIPAAQWDGWLFKHDGQAGDYYRNPDGKPDIPALQKAIDLQKQYGWLKESFDVTKYVDLSLVEDAAKRLK
ncbi:MAG TPA: ABC transporter substrate-binding protein [Stellaceae bacterium]|nr:ABC transporter substrate-binding protein [Stellaceae bacterium]